MTDKTKIAFIGSGNLGTAFASVLSQNNKYDIWLYTLNSNVANCINTNKYNPEYLSDITLHATASTNLQNVIHGSETVFITVPSFAVLDVLQNIQNIIHPNTNIVLCSKGLHDSDNFLFTDIISSTLPNNKLFVLFGPSFADGIGHGISTALNIGCKNILDCNIIQEYFTNTYVKLYPTTDLIGLQILSGIKGTIAIKIGLLESIANNLAIEQGCGPDIYTNKIYKSFSELVNEAKNIVIALGGLSETVISPAGIGDIAMVCNINKSRNKQFGILVGKIIYDKMLKLTGNNIAQVRQNFITGEIPTNLLTQDKINNLLEQCGGVVEGFFVLKILTKILAKYKIESDHFSWMCDLFAAE